MATEAVITDIAELSQDEAIERRIQRERNQAAIDLLRSWREVDEAGRQEQRETWEALKRALGQDRDSYRKLF